eukprot:510176-Amphidinium_carterae.2
MLQQEADPNLRDYEHRTALHVAAGHGRTEALHGAISLTHAPLKGTYKNAHGTAWLWKAAKLLIDYGANVNASDSMGRTPLYLCDRGLRPLHRRRVKRVKEQKVDVWFSTFHSLRSCN